MIQFFDTITKTYKPITDKKVTMYVCGPTLYDHVHVGNARPIVIFDMIYRFLKYMQYDITYVRNITDVDDKIINKAEQSFDRDINKLTDFYIKDFHEQMLQLGVLSPDYEPKATEYVDYMIVMIQKLIDNDKAYIIDNHVVFDNPSVLNPLTNQNILEMEGEKRVQKGVKRKASDWILWKPVKNGITWSSPWGDGRPAWNIECTAMIHKILGETITIHGGGIDLITPHHACSHHQSIGVSNHDYLAEIWMHNGHVMVDGKKMSKSDNNFLYLKDILKTYSGEIVRLMFLKTDYRQPLNWTTDSLEEAKNILFSWRRKIKNVSVGNVVINHLDKFDTVSWIKNVNNASPEDIKATLIYFNFYKTFDEQYVNELINSRNFYRKNKNYAEADRIRNILQKDGIQVNDLTDTTEWF